MGYYISLIDSNAKLCAEDLDEAYRILCELNNDNTQKTGGTIPIDRKDGPHENIWFSWMPWNYPDLLKSAAEIFECLGFSMIFRENGDLLLTGYDDKMGAEDVFLDSLSHLWKSVDEVENPYFAWRGEEGNMWRTIYVNGEVMEQTAKIEWS